MSYLRNMRIMDGNSTILANVNSEGRLDVVGHAHPDSGQIHYHADFSATGTYHVMLVDISDTTTFPHDYTGYAHLEWLQLSVDSNINGEYTMTLGFLKNVGSSDGDFVAVTHWSGAKQTGNNLGPYEMNLAPNGWEMVNTRILSHRTDANSTAFNTTQDRIPIVESGSSAFSGNGDVVLEVYLTGGAITVNFDMSYHSHA